MGVSVGPNIIEDGLVLTLDAADVFLPINKNLLSYTNDLSNASWAKIRCQITASATTAPDGTNTAFAMNITDATGLVRLSQSSISSSIAGGPYTFSVYVKQNTSTAQLLDLGIYNPPTTAGTEPSYDILNSFAITGSGGSSISRVVTSVGNGWYRVATTATISNNSVWYLFFDIEAGTGTKVNGQGIYLWGPQFEYGTVATEYQPVNVTTRVWPNLVNQSISGSLINNPTFNSANGGSIVFDGVNDYINVPTFIIPTASFSCESFFQWDNIGTNRGSIFSLNYNYPTSGYLIRQRDDSSGKFVIWSDYGSEAGIYSTAALTINTWNHVVVVQSSNNCSIYINGVLDSSQTLQNPVLNQSYPILLGTRAFSGGSAGAYLTGKISVAKIYNRALSAQEVLQNYNVLKSRFNL